MTIPTPTTRSRARAPRRPMTLLAGGLLAACGGSSGSDDLGGGADLTMAYQGTYGELLPLFARSCNFGSCHGQSAKGGLRLDDATAFCNLTGATQGKTDWTAAQPELPRRVVPGDRARSFLYKKLSLSTMTSTTYGDRMPQGTSLDPAEVEAFGRWIDLGAKDQTNGAGNCL